MSFAGLREGESADRQAEQDGKAYGGQLGPCARVVWVLRSGALGLNRSGCNAVYPYSIRTQLNSSLFGEHLNSALARCVGHQRREREFVATRAQVHDRTSSVVFHVLRGLLRAQEATF